MNELLVNGMAERGVRDSFWIVIGRAKREDWEVNVLNASWRSLLAGMNQYWLRYSRELICWREVPVIPDCILVGGLLRFERRRVTGFCSVVPWQ